MLSVLNNINKKGEKIMANNNDEKKGFGPALAAMILAIVGFVITGIIALTMSGLKDIMTETFSELIADMLGPVTATTPEEIAALDTVKLGLKVGVGAVFFSGGLFMLISFICDIVAICKYYGNKCDTKAASTIVLAYIGLALLVTSIIIAIVGINGYMPVIEKIMAPYYG